MTEIINELGELALSTRLYRLSELTRKDVTRIYKENGIAFESKWFPVLYVLSRKKSLGVIELSNELGYAHPSVIALIKEMEKAKLIKSVPSRTDGRKRLLSLTLKAVNMMIRMQPLWDIMRVVAAQIYNNKISLLSAVEATENAIRKESYYDRYKKVVARKKKG